MRTSWPLGRHVAPFYSGIYTARRRRDCFGAARLAMTAEMAGNALLPGTDRPHAQRHRVGGHGAGRSPSLKTHYLVIASAAKQSRRRAIFCAAATRLLRRYAPRNDSRGGRKRPTGEGFQPTGKPYPTGLSSRFTKAQCSFSCVAVAATCADFAKIIALFFQSTLIKSFGPKRPSRISRDSGFSSCCWIARFNGRAP